MVRRRRERQVKRRTSSRSYCLRARLAARNCFRAAAEVSGGAPAVVTPGVASAGSGSPGRRSGKTGAIAASGRWTAIGSVVAAGSADAVGADAGGRAGCVGRAPLGGRGVAGGG